MHKVPLQIKANDSYSEFKVLPNTCLWIISTTTFPAITNFCLNLVNKNFYVKIPASFKILFDNEGHT